MTKDNKNSNKNIILIVEIVIIALLAILIIALLSPNIKRESLGDSLIGKLWSRISNNVQAEEVLEEDPSNAITIVSNEDKPISIKDKMLSLSSNVSISDNTVSLSSNDLSEDNEASTEDGIKIVVFGDSIWANDRSDTGIANLVGDRTPATVYNCAVGGSSATTLDTKTVIEKWNSYSLNGLMYVATGQLSADYILTGEGANANEIIKTVDFHDVDYIVIAYGMNDYLSKAKIWPDDMLDMTTYVGALRHATYKFKEFFPQAKVILVSPTLFITSKDGVVTESGYTKNFGEGTEEEYANAVKQVAIETDTLFFDAFSGIGITPDTATQYLKDGIHLNENGRQAYSTALAEFIKNNEAGETR